MRQIVLASKSPRRKRLLENIGLKFTIIPSNINSNTFAWSAEGVLYDVFKVRSTRNYYYEADMTELLEIISGNRDEQQNERAKELIVKLAGYILNEKDPLNAIIAEAKIIVESA